MRPCIYIIWPENIFSCDLSLVPSRLPTAVLHVGPYLDPLGIRCHIVILRGAVIHVNVVSSYVMTVVVGENENKARDNL